VSVVVKSCDVAIVGGGVIGSAVAYFLAADPGFDGSVLVLERDPTYQRSSTALSAASIRQQFSTPENIEMSLFGAEFVRNVGRVLAVGDDVPDLAFVEQGYLFLAGPAGLEVMQENHEVQRSLGADVGLLDPAALQARFPWLNMTDLAMGSLGLSGEGWFDAYSLMQAFRRKAIALGVTYRSAQVVGMRAEGARVRELLTEDGQEIACGVVVNAAGPHASEVAAMAGIDLQVRSRKRCVFVFDCRSPIKDCPLVIDPSGVYFRPEGNSFIGGISPPAGQDPDTHDFDVDHHLFEDLVWPVLAQRVSAFEAIKPIRAWAGHYAYNLLDQNAILGAHPELTNFYFANGFSGHGLQHAPAVGRGIAELISHGSYQSLDLSRLSFERMLTGRAVTERNVV
jgi:FAD-dependent oxidoreductase domain-containing protein 1